MLLVLHFLLEAGVAVPHALMTSPRRLARAWLSLPLAGVIALGMPILVAEFRGANVSEHYSPVQNLISFAARIDRTRDRVSK
jgi:hypothetical protein